MAPIWPTNIAAKVALPHSAVPQNPQTRRCARVSGGWSGLRESIRRLSAEDCGHSGAFRRSEPENDGGWENSRQRPLQQRTHIVAFQIHRAVHAGMAGGVVG